MRVTSKPEPNSDAAAESTFVPLQAMRAVLTANYERPQISPIPDGEWPPVSTMRLVLFVLVLVADREGVARNLSRVRMMELTGFGSRNTARYALAALEVLGHIKCVHKKYGGASYEIRLGRGPMPAHSPVLSSRARRLLHELDAELQRDAEQLALPEASNG